MRYERAGDYLNDGVIEDGALLTAPGVRLTNAGVGRIYGGVRFEAGGATFTNAAGGIVRLSREADPAATVAITGSAGADVVVNAGLIGGTVSLGDGDDSFTDAGGISYGVELGTGADTYRVSRSDAPLTEVEGGDGRDRLVLASASANGGYFLEFEDLVLEGGGSFYGFSNYEPITLAGTGARGAYTFIGAYNPRLDLALSGQDVWINSSTFRAITGSGADEQLTISGETIVTGDLRLGAGNDELVIYPRNTYRFALIVDGKIDGGDGVDGLNFSYSFGGGERAVTICWLRAAQDLLTSRCLRGVRCDYDPQRRRLHVRRVQFQDRAPLDPQRPARRRRPGRSGRGPVD